MLQVLYFDIIQIILEILVAVAGLHIRSVDDWPWWRYVLSECLSSDIL